MRKLLLILTLGFIPLVAFCPEISSRVKEQHLFQAKKQIFERDIYNKSLTPSLLWEALYYAEIKQPEIVYKQAIIETGWFNSELCREANNIFGMRLPKVRPTTAIGEYNYHAKYDHWYSSVKDYALLQTYYLNQGYSFNEYLIFLEDIGYATDSLYIDKIKTIFKTS